MKEKPSDVKQQLKETVQTPELFLLSVMPGNIDEIKSYPVSYLATIVRKGDVKNQITVLDSAYIPKTGRKQSHRNKRSVLRKYGE